MGYDPALLCGGLLIFNEPSRDKIRKKPEKFEEFLSETGYRYFNESENPAYQYFLR